MTTRAEQIADSLVETVAAAGYLPQNRTFSALEISDLKATLAEEVAAALSAERRDALNDADGMAIKVMDEEGGAPEFETDYDRGWRDACVAIQVHIHDALAEEATK